MAGVLTLGAIVVPWIDKLSIPEALQWLNPFSVSGRTNLIFNLSYYVANGGTAMLSDYAAFVGKVLLLLLLGGSALLLGRRWRLRQPGLRLLVMLLALSLPGFALERRHSTFVTVAANETVDDTLLASGNIVRVEGVVNGDLLAFGGTVEVRGTVKGDLVSFAKRIVVSGTVEGNIFNLSSSLDLDGQLGHSLYGLMQSLHVNDRGRIGEGMVVGAGNVTLEGEVNRSVTVYAGNADVSGSVGRELTMAGDNLTLTNTARIGGNLSARVRRLSNVHIASGATIVGTRDIQVRVRQSRFARPKFYFYQAVWLAAAMLVGWLAMVLFPGFFQSQHAGGGFRLAQPRAGVCGSGGRTRGYRRDSHHAGWPSGLAHVAHVLSGRNLPGKDLGWSIPGADTSEANWSDEERLADGTTGGPAHPHHRQVRPVSWRPDPLRCGLFGPGSVCLAALSGFTTGNNDLKNVLRLVEARQDLKMASWKRLLAVVLLKDRHFPGDPSTRNHHGGTRTQRSCVEVP